MFGKEWRSMKKLWGKEFQICLSITKEMFMLMLTGTMFYRRRTVLVVVNFLISHFRPLKWLVHISAWIRCRRSGMFFSSIFFTTRACSFSDSGVQKGFKPQGLWIVFVRYCDCLQLSSLEHEAFRPYNATIQGPCMAVVSLMGCPHFPSYSQLI